MRAALAKAFTGLLLESGKDDGRGFALVTTGHKCGFETACHYHLLERRRIRTMCYESDKCQSREFT